MTLSSNEDDKLRSPDRILIIEEIPGEQTKDSKGLVESRIFKGGNRLHAIRDPQYDMWYMRYDAGILPQPLQQRFTTFSKLFEFVTGYFQRRGLKISRVED